MDIISIQFNFTTIAYGRSLKETKSQDRYRFILGSPLVEENLVKIPLYRCIKSTKIKPQTCAPYPCRYVSLSHICAIHKCVCLCFK